MTAYDLRAKRIEVAQSAKARRCDPYDESILGICGVLAREQANHRWQIEEYRAGVVERRRQDRLLLFAAEW